MVIERSNSLNGPLCSRRTNVPRMGMEIPYHRNISEENHLTRALGNMTEPAPSHGSQPALERRQLFIVVKGTEDRPGQRDTMLVTIKHCLFPLSYSQDWETEAQRRGGSPRV